MWTKNSQLCIAQNLNWGERDIIGLRCLSCMWLILILSPCHDGTPVIPEPGAKSKVTLISRTMGCGPKLPPHNFEAMTTAMKAL